LEPSIRPCEIMTARVSSGPMRAVPPAGRLHLASLGLQARSLADRAINPEEFSVRIRRVHRRILFSAQTCLAAVGGLLVGRFHGLRSYRAEGFGPWRRLGSCRPTPATHPVVSGPARVARRGGGLLGNKKARRDGRASYRSVSGPALKACRWYLPGRTGNGRFCLVSHRQEFRKMRER
jgi:hypothetical protein